MSEQRPAVLLCGLRSQLREFTREQEDRLIRERGIENPELFVAYSNEGLANSLVDLKGRLKLIIATGWLRQYDPNGNGMSCDFKWWLKEISERENIPLHLISEALTVS